MSGSRTSRHDILRTGSYRVNTALRIHHDDAFRADSEQGAGDVSSPEVRAVQYHGLLMFPAVPAHRNKERADERTRTADLISLRVCGQWLLDVAQDCIFSIGKECLVPSIAHYCRVLRPG